MNAWNRNSGTVDMSNFHANRRVVHARGLSGSVQPGFVAFTLIELLVVISIIGVLAGLVLGLTGVASRKGKEGRIKVEMTKLINAIENYKSAVGYYPPDHQILSNNVPVGLPSPNQLFYELSGTVFNTASRQFYVPGRGEPLNPNQIQSVFNTSGFANAGRDQKDVKFTEEFKASQVRRISANPPVDVLVVPVPGPKPGPGSWSFNLGSAGMANPWLYVSTSPTNNPDRFDLWAEVVIGNKRVRFSNWEKDPVVVGP